ncbi:hypothetical protein AVEN_196447-1 [Araneus ventricosus]|uniref:Uncharacterized protein n=1 Tax=Araneus ventricosus TaxID=182803 RepID=A0A4Y2AWT0_ARAVE|nr:hypothetical protein AVEN_196447-1 [Araneus ventricosus]
MSRLSLQNSHPRLLLSPLLRECESLTSPPPHKSTPVSAFMDQQSKWSAWISKLRSTPFQLSSIFHIDDRFCVEWSFRECPVLTEGMLNPSSESRTIMP